MRKLVKRKGCIKSGDIMNRDLRDRRQPENLIC